MNLTLTDVENILRSELSSFRQNDRWEDGIQEGLIRAWKDMEEGLTDKWHIVNRAKLWAKQFIINLDGHRHPTGHVRRSMESNPHIKPITRTDGRIDWKAYKEFPLSDAAMHWDDEQDYPHNAKTPSFEDDLLDRLAFDEMVAPLEHEQKQALYLCHVVGSTHQEIADFLGVKFGAAATRRIKKAHKALEGTL